MWQRRALEGWRGDAVDRLLYGTQDHKSPSKDKAHRTFLTVGIVARLGATWSHRSSGSFARENVLGETFGDYETSIVLGLRLSMPRSFIKAAMPFATIALTTSSSFKPVAATNWSTV